ncbi:MAG TPA: D-alanyl-D-alanine carboxypeptidase/D-alanyl-D-alanine-endopeptidase [Blastocatellia bacterium]|nr:D-alanyl-D-alanine carboxypeptidase/D-alanyl-D-alanine-endopeptidase [Blastocatellia bacterium]
MTSSVARRISGYPALISLLICLHAFEVLSISASPSKNKSLPLVRQQTGALQSETLDSLRGRIAAHLGQARFAPAAWGVKIVSLDTGRTIFEHNPEKYFNPASNAKLYTAALALENLGIDYRIKTSLYSAAKPDASGTLKADLILYGRGDPTMAARLNGGNYYKGIEPLISQLVNAGVRRIEGDVVGDESYFTGPPFGSGWEWDDLQAYYGAEASALTIDDNALDLFVKPSDRTGMPCRITTGPPTSFVTLINRSQTSPKGSEPRIVVYRPVGENIIYVSGRLPIDSSGYYTSVAVHNPAGLFASLFKETLGQHGITVTGRTRVIDWKYREVTPLDLNKLIELGSVESIPLGEIVRETLKPSQNLYAQLLLLQVGANAGRTSDENAGVKAVGTPSRQNSNVAASRATAAEEIASNEMTTEEIGVELMNDFLAKIGIKKGDVLLEEGSGLSRRDVITPRATVALLSYMSRSRWAEAYRNALPVAGVDGTLQNRMKGTLAAGNVRAKTGSLRYVYTLSGYVTSAAGERLAFSIMLNNYYNPERAAALRDPAGTASGRPAPPAPRDDIDAIPIMLAGFTGRSQ